MGPNTRLRWTGGMILVSAGYAVLVAKDPEVAQAIALGYVALLLTIFVLVGTWKKP